MKKLAFVFAILLTFSANAAEVDLNNYYSAAKIQYMGDQWYQQDFTNEKLTFMADVVTRQCFFIDRRWNAVLLIDCKNLVKRKEWEDVLVWLKNK